MPSTRSRTEESTSSLKRSGSCCSKRAWKLSAIQRPPLLSTWGPKSVPSDDSGWGKKPREAHTHTERETRVMWRCEYAFVHLLGFNHFLNTGAPVLLLFPFAFRAPILIQYVTRQSFGGWPRSVKPRPPGRGWPWILAQIPMHGEARLGDHTNKREREPLCG